ncbi:Major facilitator, sugar transporter-like [Sesbania bispinosa]|nr:Major facilitator, sugar transporter-like [Sesbania bispinosa]
MIIIGAIFLPDSPTNESSKAVKHPWATLLKTQYRPQLTMAIAISFFQQLTGMNVITLKEGLEKEGWTCA